MIFANGFFALSVNLSCEFEFRSPFKTSILLSKSRSLK